MRGMRTMVAALLATWMLSGAVVDALAPLAVSERPSFAELSDLRGQFFKPWILPSSLVLARLGVVADRSLAALQPRAHNLHEPHLPPFLP